MKFSKRYFIPILAIIAGIIIVLFIIHFIIQRENTVTDKHLERLLGYGAREEIVFDQSYTQASSPYDTGFAGMSTLTRHLRRRGIAVSINFKPLDVLLEKFRGPGHVLVLGVPTVLPAAYRVADRDAVRSFVSSGGGLMLIVEHDNAYNNHNLQRALLASYGVEVNIENAFGKMESVDETNWPVSSCPLWGFNNIKYYYAASLKEGKGAEIFTHVNRPLSPERAVNGVISQKQNGLVVVLGDYEILWNMTPGSGIRYGDNLAFITRTFDFLLNRKKPMARTKSNIRKYTELQERGSKGTILFSRRGEGLVPDKSISGLFGFAKKLNNAGYRIVSDDGTMGSSMCDCVVLACPVTSCGDITSILKARKVLLICDGLSSTMEADENMQIFINTMSRDYGLMYDPREYGHPLNTIAAPMGFIFSPVTVLTDTESNQYEAPALWIDNGTAFTLRRGCGIAPAKGGFPPDLRLQASTGEECWPGKNPIAVFIAPGVAGRYTPGPERRGSLPVAVSSSKVFAFSDIELLSNQYINTPEGEELVRRIVEWIASDI